jgi:hypothetical protein
VDTTANQLWTIHKHKCGSKGERIAGSYSEETIAIDRIVIRTNQNRVVRFVEPNVRSSISKYCLASPTYPFAQRPGYTSGEPELIQPHTHEERRVYRHKVKVKMKKLRRVLVVWWECIR